MESNLGLHFFGLSCRRKREKFFEILLQSVKFVKQRQTTFAMEENEKKTSSQPEEKNSISKSVGGCLGEGCGSLLEGCLGSVVILGLLIVLVAWFCCLPITWS